MAWGWFSSPPPLWPRPICYSNIERRRTHNTPAIHLRLTGCHSCSPRPTDCTGKWSIQPFLRLYYYFTQVYQTIEFTRLVELAQFTTPFHLERLLVDCVRHNDMQIRIDHGKRCIHFGIDLSESQREDKPEGPTLQSMPSEQVRNQLVNMSTVLHQSIAIINPNKKRVRTRFAHYVFLRYGAFV